MHFHHSDLWAGAGSRIDIDGYAVTRFAWQHRSRLETAGILCERSGVINIAMGLMLTGPALDCIGALLFDGTWVGLVVAVIAGGGSS